LRKSGQIEQDADQVIFIQREEVISPGSRLGTADFYIRKNRHGEIGKVELVWQGKYQRFVNSIQVGAA
jgi:replicative DNA helicase